MTANKIALFGHNSALGRHVIKYLVSSPSKPALKVYHRPGSKTEVIPPGIARVQIDYEDEGALAKALHGIDVVV